MAAIFGATAPTKSRMFQVGRALATISDVPAVLTGVTIQVQRQMSPIPTLTDGVVWSAQPVQGTLTAQSIVTTPETGTLLSKIAEGGACDPLTCRVTMNSGCSMDGVVMEITDGYCSVLTFSANGNQGYIGNDFTIQFTTCNITTGGAG